MVDLLVGCDLLVIWQKPCTPDNQAADKTAGLSDSRTGSSDKLPKHDAFAIIEATAHAGVEEVACGRLARVAGASARWAAGCGCSPNNG